MNGMGVSCVVRIYGERLRGSGVMLWFGRGSGEVRVGGGGGGRPTHPSKEHAHKSSPSPRCSTVSPS